MAANSSYWFSLGALCKQSQPDFRGNFHWWEGLNRLETSCQEPLQALNNNVKPKLTTGTSVYEH